MPRDVFVIETQGSGKNQKSYWRNCGVAFDPNRDGSVNFKLDLFPNVHFQIRNKPNGELQPTEKPEQAAEV